LLPGKKLCRLVCLLGLLPLLALLPPGAPAAAAVAAASPAPPGGGCCCCSAGWPGLDWVTKELSTIWPAAPSQQEELEQHMLHHRSAGEQVPTRGASSRQRHCLPACAPGMAEVRHGRWQRSTTQHAGPLAPPQLAHPCLAPLCALHQAPAPAHQSPLPQHPACSAEVARREASVWLGKRGVC
jgi:hypothetical protein